MRVLSKREYLIVSIGIPMIVVYIFMKYIGHDLNKQNLEANKKIESLNILLTDKQTYLNDLTSRDLNQEILIMKENIAHKLLNKFHLKAILNSKSYVNDSWYGIGDDINGCSLFEIGVDSVKIRCGNLIKVLNLNISQKYIEVL